MMLKSAPGRRIGPELSITEAVRRWVGSAWVPAPHHHLLSCILTFPASVILMAAPWGRQSECLIPTGKMGTLRLSEVEQLAPGDRVSSCQSRALGCGG